VGEDGPELEITGPSRIHNAQQTQQLLAGLQGGDSSEVRQAIESLQKLIYDIGRQQLVLLHSIESLARKSDALGVKQRESA
jgi:fibronectin type 3 domain-containing protein